VISLSDLRKVYRTRGDREVVALDGIDLHVPRGEVHGIVGESGAGKSTLIRCLTALEEPSSGTVAIDGVTLTGLGERELRRQRRRIGMVFQRFNLFPHKTALENIIEGPVQVLGEPVKEARDRASALLERVGLADKANHYPSELSGDQQQRVAIARAMGMRPDLILFDEPTSALDPELVSEVLDVMRDLAASGMTMIVVTHELGFARNVANTVTFMETGKVVETGLASEVLSTPKSARTAEFIKAVHS
jgi:polar amino acid transport system ATP-binding protein